MRANRPPAGESRTNVRRKPGILPLALVALLLPATPAIAQVPTPESVIGWEAGADYRLADYGQIVDYFEALEAVSDRVSLREIGETAEGRPMIMAVISSAENLGRLEEYREISERLATDPGLDDEEARALARDGRAVLWIDGGLHSTEVAGSQFPPLFAYRMATGESEEIRRIRDRAIILLMPVMNPDGLEIVAEWYRSNVGTPFETADLPVLYHRYVGHDNNRDWFMITQPETRAVTRQLWHEWFPQIVVNHHQTSPFPGRIFIPPFADPVNPDIPPLVIAGNNLVGTALHQRFVEEGKPGAVSRLTYTQWWNGGMRTAPFFHNQIGVLTEVALHRYATPRYYHPDSIPDSFSGGLAADRARTWYPDPWEGGWWRLRDAVEYMVTASMGAARIASDRRADWLFNVYRMARRSVEAGREGDPYAYVISLAEQHDAGEALELVGVLRRGGIEVHRATEPFGAEGTEYPAGAYIAYAGQPFRPHLMDLMEPQEYPDRRAYPGGPPITPYDLAGWTLPAQMGVEVARVETPFEAAVEPVSGSDLRVPEGEVAGGGDRYLLAPGRNASYRAVNDLLGRGVPVARAAESFREDGEEWPAGTFLVGSERDSLGPLAREEGLRFVAFDAEPPPSYPLAEPRVGLYRSWVPSMDEGWTRWLFERHGFEFETLRDRDMRSGDLSRYDAIVLPHQSAEDIHRGHLEGTMPERYTGGVGAEGAANLSRFVRDGGTLIALDGASEFAIRHFGLPVRNAVAGLADDEFFIPGSLVRLRVDPDRPLGFGMAREAAASFVRSRAFDVIPPASGGGEGAPAREPEPRQGAADAAEPAGSSGEREGSPTRPGEAAARYGSEDLLLSGWEVGAEDHLSGKAALLRLPEGEGQVVLFAFRPQFRAQPRGTFKLLFNAIHASTMEGLPAGTLEVD